MRVSFDTIAWANGADYEPEDLYSDSIPIEEYEAKTGQTLLEIASSYGPHKRAGAWEFAAFDAPDFLRVF